MNRSQRQRPGRPAPAAVSFRRNVVMSLAVTAFLLAASSGLPGPAAAPVPSKGTPVASGHDREEALQRPVPPPAISENEAEIFEIEGGERPVPTRTSALLSAIPRAPSSLVAEMMDVLAQEATSLAELQDRFEAATDHVAALAVQREIEDVKQRTELSLLRIQVRYAHQEGRNELAARLEAAIDEITNPQTTVRGEPLERRNAAPRR